jgi:uncharacterized protein YbaR (Trm112 family)
MRPFGIEELLEILVCPACKSPVRLEGDDRLVCTRPDCGLRYPIRDGIPIMVLDEAKR